MPESKITRKGQATIPQSIRKVLHVGPSDRIAFHVRNGKVWIEGKKKDLDSLFGKYRYKSRKRVTVADMNKAIQERIAGNADD